MTDPTAKPQPVAPTTATAPPIPGEIEKLCSAGLAYWEARLIVEARQLRNRQNRAMLVEWDGEGRTMHLREAVPFVGQQCDMLLLSWGQRIIIARAVVTPKRISLE